MSSVDLGLLVILLIGGLLGFMRGAIRQVTSFVAGFASLVLPYFYGAPVAHLVANHFDAPYPVAYVVTAFALGAIGQIATRLVLLLIRKIVGRGLKVITTAGESEAEKKEDVRKGFQGGLADRTVGGFFGAGKWALAAWILFSAIALIAAPLKQRGMKFAIDDSSCYQLARQHNAFTFLWSSEVAKLDSALGKLAKPPGKAGAAQKYTSSYDALSKDERVQQLLSDERTRRAMREGDFTVLAESPQFLSLVTDPEAMEHAINVAQSQTAGPVSEAR